MTKVWYGGVVAWWQKFISPKKNASPPNMQAPTTKCKPSIFKKFFLQRIEFGSGVYYRVGLYTTYRELEATVGTTFEPHRFC